VFKEKPYNVVKVHDSYVVLVKGYDWLAGHIRKNLITRDTKVNK
jgi:hypothetical protein